jgi:cell division protein FtsW (lipid II flippase)
VLTYIETAVLIAAVGVPVHYFAGLDWPWALVIGSAASIILRFMIHSEPMQAWRKRAVTRGR